VDFIIFEVILKIFLTKNVDFAPQMRLFRLKNKHNIFKEKSVEMTENNGHNIDPSLGWNIFSWIFCQTYILKDKIFGFKDQFRPEDFWPKLHCYENLSGRSFKNQFM
jgi:hypothetical protein